MKAEFCECNIIGPHCPLHNEAPRLLAALKKMLDHYLALANSGDAGFWNPEGESVVIESREAIAKAESTK